jgi:hypothetical protein
MATTIPSPTNLPDQEEQSEKERTLAPQERTQAYFRLFEGLILPNILEVYWEQVWDLRKNNAFAPHAIWKDFFQQMCKVDKEAAIGGRPQKSGEGELIPCAVVMPARWFWELTLAIYYLLDHGERKPDGWWERKLLDCVEDAGVDPKEYMNMNDGIWVWLRKVANGTLRNQFWDNPIYTVYLCKASTWLEQAHGMGKLLGTPMDYLTGQRTSPEVTGMLNKIWAECEKECKKFLSKRTTTEEDNTELTDISGPIGGTSPELIDVDLDTEDYNTPEDSPIIDV